MFWQYEQRENIRVKTFLSVKTYRMDGDVVEKEILGCRISDLSQSGCRLNIPDGECGGVNEKDVLLLELDKFDLALRGGVTRSPERLGAWGVSTGVRFFDSDEDLRRRIHEMLMLEGDHTTDSERRRFVNQRYKKSFFKILLFALAIFAGILIIFIMNNLPESKEPEVKKRDRLEELYRRKIIAEESAKSAFGNGSGGVYDENTSTHTFFPEDDK